jgi:hypothetical protein
MPSLPEFCRRCEDFVSRNRYKTSCALATCLALILQFGFASGPVGTEFQNGYPWGVTVAAYSFPPISGILETSGPRLLRTSQPAKQKSLDGAIAELFPSLYVLCIAQGIAVRFQTCIVKNEACLICGRSPPQ